MTDAKKNHQANPDASTTQHQLVLHNDNINTFDWVIKALVEVCEMEYMQAEQCSMIIHSNGHYTVKKGQLFDLQQMKKQIDLRGITATIE